MDGTLRVLLSEPARGWTGETAYVASLARGLAARGVEVRVACRAGSELESRLGNSSIPVVAAHLDHRRSLLPGLLRDLRLCRRLAREFDPHVVHANASWDTWVMAAGFRRLRHPALRLRTKHNLKRIRRSWPNRFLYRRVLHHVIAPSVPVRDHLRASGMIAEDRIHLVWYGVELGRYRLDPDARAAGKARLAGLFPGAPLVAAYVSRLTERKHPEHAIAAVRALRDRPGRPPVVLVVAGGLETGHARRAQELAGGDPRIRFLGFQADVAPVLAGADLFLLPSPAEAFGMAVIEAMAAGVVPVLPRAGAFPALVEEDRTGLLYDPGEPVAGLVAALETLRADPARVERLAAAAPAAAARFSSERMVGETLALYRRLLAGRAPGSPGPE